ncbi:MAG: UDP-3-O-acyl-N-acetylglucosamine deacetylase [Candidatus Aminicenantales bacterium]
MKALKSTVSQEISLSGVGIHTGQKVDLLLKPSSSGRMVFRRLDLGNMEMELDAWRVFPKRGTVLQIGPSRVMTLEHLLATLYVFGIDSLTLELNGEEVPIMDGSASPFVKAVKEAGVSSLKIPKKEMRIIKSARVEEGEAFVFFSPHKSLRITYTIEYDHPLIKRQEYSLELNEESFAREIAPARTFGFLSEVPSLLKEGLARGGSLVNAVVLDEKGVIGGKLRFADEFVRHKIIDFVGDLSLLGHPLIGHFRGYKAGHSLHLKAVRFLLENHEYWNVE